MVAPPRAYVLAADFGNTIAGVLLCCAFLLGALMFNTGSVEIGESSLGWLTWFFNAEGFFYAFAQFFMIGIMANTPPEFGGGDRGCMQFAILMAGGIFFSFSGLVLPQCISNITYIFSKDACTFPHASGPYVWNAMAHFGITCFMVGTTIGFTGILGAPKDKLISPFWGVTMYFMGAWTIGIFKFWGPVLLGGFDLEQNSATHFDMTAPSVTYSLNWWFALLGAIFLTTGAVIFGIMNGSFGISPPAAPPVDSKFQKEQELSFTENRVC